MAMAITVGIVNIFSLPPNYLNFPRIMKIFLISLWLLAGLLWAEAQGMVASTDSVVTAFPEKFFIQFYAQYNYAAFSGESTDNKDLKTNLPVHIGFGGGYGPFSWTSMLSMSFGADEDLPITKAANLQFNYFSDRIFGDAEIGVNDGFYKRERFEEKDKAEAYQLMIIKGSLSINYIWNKDHSLRAVYNMDRRQWKSNGSFILGIGAYYHGIESKDSALSFYSEMQSFVHAGPSAGYSYNWIWDNGMFGNLLIVGTTSVGKNVTRNEWMQFYQIFPKGVLGYHSHTWSINFPLILSLLWIHENDGKVGDFFLEASAGFTITKRF
ncbi:uncharacterized protein DUF4421 [Hallerella porci]|uniref:Uncharacterized protein DUF4421 n=2 Tax=Hallerella porci TaxID=1945871 RepID=A0ABX5LJF8_9BACT|nr:uncharacterized protein DUF4421 [Hallerella porci]